MRDGLDEVGRLFDEDDQASVSQAARKLALVAIGLLLAQLPEAWHYDRPLSVEKRNHRAADAGVRDDDARSTDVLEISVKRQEIDTNGAFWADARYPVLDDDVLF